MLRLLHGRVTVIDARRHGQERALVVAWKMYKARFASVTTFWFARKEPKSLPQDTLHRLKIYLNCNCGSGSAPDPTRGAYSTPTDPPPAVFEGSASQQRRNRVDRTGRKGVGWEEKNGETGERMERKRGDRLCHLLKELLRAPTVTVAGGRLTSYRPVFIACSGEMTRGRRGWSPGCRGNSVVCGGITSLRYVITTE